jgi:polyvinyl alcohol dehydrogenase (cytochrome)
MLSAESVQETRFRATWRSADVLKLEWGMRCFLTAVVTAFVFCQADVGSQQSTRGEQVYKQRCAACHDRTLPRMPNREALRGFAPEEIEIALSSFTMQRQASGLSASERRAVAEFLTGRAPGSYRAPLDRIPKRAYCDSISTRERDLLAGPAWNGWGGGPANTRYQSGSVAGLTIAELPRLRVKWAFGFPGVSASGSQISIVGRRAFVGSRNGMIYALDRATGCIQWTFEADAGVRSTPVVGRRGSGEALLFFGDAHAQVYAVDALTGSLRWKVKVETHPDATITGGVAYDDGRLFVPISSFELATAGMPTFECCTFRGSVVALDATTGRNLWTTHTINRAAERTTKNSVGTQVWGPSGAAVWSAPTLDPGRNRLYVGTGNSYSNPPAPTSDAILALAMDTGRILWSRQTLAGDAWNDACLEPEGPGRANCPSSPGPDHDFGSSPALVMLPDGRSVLAVGQKSGVLHGLNPDTGAILWQTRVGVGGVLGGIEWGFATDGGHVYASLSGAFEQRAGEAGGLAAVKIANGELMWEAPRLGNTCGAKPRCNTGQPAAVTAIPGVVFSGSLDGHLRAYDASTGKVVWDFDTDREFETVNGVSARGGSFNGPGVTVVDGMVYVSSGYSSLGFMPGNVLLAFSVDSQ